MVGPASQISAKLMFGNALCASLAVFIKEFVRRLREREFHEANDYKMDEPNC